MSKCKWCESSNISSLNGFCIWCEDAICFAHDVLPTFLPKCLCGLVADFCTDARALTKIAATARRVHLFEQPEPRSEYPSITRNHLRSYTERIQSMAEDWMFRDYFILECTQDEKRRTQKKLFFCSFLPKLNFKMRLLTFLIWFCALVLCVAGNKAAPGHRRRVEHAQHRPPPKASTCTPHGLAFAPIAIFGPIANRTTRITKCSVCTNAWRKF
jgi:hypothetical protein